MFGWWVTEKYGPVRRRQWCLHGDTARVAYAAAQRSAGAFMDSLKGVLSWQLREGSRRVEPWC